jgi:hypothetical protein
MLGAWFHMLAAMSVMVAFLSVLSAVRPGMAWPPSARKAWPLAEAGMRSWRQRARLGQVLGSQNVGEFLGAISA